VNKKIIINSFFLLITLFIAAWILFIVNYRNTTIAITKDAQELTIQNKTDEAMTLCDKIIYRKSGCYSSVVNVLIDRRINGEDIPFTEELCNRLTPETVHPFWTFFIKDKEGYNEVMLENRKRCMGRID